MSAPVPHALAASSEPIASTSLASKVKAPTISKIHITPQQAITRFSSLAPFDANEWDQPLVSPGSIQEVVPHYWDKVAYVAKPLSLKSLPHQRAMTDEQQSKLDIVVAERDQGCKCTLICCAMWGYCITMSNSLKSSSFRFWGLPQDFNLCNPYNHGSTGHLASDMKEYPEIDPDNFTETLILYDSSLPHFPYVTHYPYDPDLHYTHMMYPPVGEPSFSCCAW